MRIVVCALAALSLAACATTPVPQARPLNAEQIAAIGPTSVAVTANNNGVAKSWMRQDSSAAGASQGVLGVLVSAAIDGIMNYAPGRRAARQADELAEAMPVERLTTSLADQFRRQIPANPTPGAIVVSDVVTVQKIEAPAPVNDALEVAANYRMSEDSTTLQVEVALSYLNPDIPYVTPYSFEGSPPREETVGPTYRNTFTYFSQQLPVPVLTAELKERLVASVEENSRDENGALPAEGTDAFKAMTKALEEARDDELSKGEISIFLTREWTRNNGALLQAEIENAHALAARYALLDMNRTAVPSLDGVDEVVETLPDGRIIRRIGSGYMAGSYVSAPSNVTSFTSYGNTISIGRENQARIEALRAAARARSRSAR